MIVLIIEHMVPSDPKLLEHIEVLRLFDTNFMKLCPPTIGYRRRGTRMTRTHPGQCYYYRGDKNFHFIRKFLYIFQDYLVIFAWVWDTTMTKVKRKISFLFIYKFFKDCLI